MDRKRILRVTIDIYDDGTSKSRYSPGLHDNRATEPVWSALDLLIRRLRWCQALRHVKDRVA